jgi:predicted short-subunit dehydrogenase-like oxidoreductase (DUF2520 family)
LIGAGRVGTAVALLLRRAGWTLVGVASRSDDSARRASERTGAPVFPLEGAIPEADLYVIGATDEGIGALAATLSGRLPAGSIALHLSGSLGTEVLGPLAAQGVKTCALHPVQACPDIETALRRLPGSAWGVTCAPDLDKWARDLVVEVFDGTPISVPEEARTLWHASSVMTSNGISALLAFGEDLLRSLGIEDPGRVLGPLAAGTVANAREGGGGHATLTGPIARGEVNTVVRHMEVLRIEHPDLLHGYRLVAASILEAAERAGKLDASVAEAMREALG